MKKILTIIILVIFLIMSLGIQGVYGEGVSISGRRIFDAGEKYRDGKTFSAAAFILPAELGKVEKISLAEGPAPKTIIHIQDAHCNYFAQHKIAGILDYLKEKYGIRTVNLEGGKGGYDLSVFTDIKDKEVRETVCDEMVFDGIVNGAEYYASLNPEDIVLWGVEDPDKYFKDLKAFYSLDSTKNNTSKSIELLANELEKIKKQLFDDDLKRLDKCSMGFWQKKTSLSDYLSYLVKTAKENNVPVGPDIALLSEVNRLGRDLDFKTAETERDEVIEVLKDRLSTREKKELIKKINYFSTGGINEVDLYQYIILKSVSLGVPGPVNLIQYVEYLKKSKKINEGHIFEQINKAEENIAQKFAASNNQLEAWKLSHNLLFIKKMISINIEPGEYELYLENREDFTITKYINFINKNDPGSKVLENKEELYLPCKEAERFYGLSYERDRSFVRNIKFSSGPAHEKNKQADAAVIITGGFHSQNLKRIFNRKNISYIQIFPNFKTPENYKDPYYNLLIGGESVLMKQVRVSTSMIALKSLFSELGFNAAERETLRIASKVLEAAIKDKDIVVETDGGPVMFYSSGAHGGKKVNICGYEMYVEKEKDEEMDYLSGDISYGKSQAGSFSEARLPLKGKMSRSIGIFKKLNLNSISQWLKAEIGLEGEMRDPLIQIDASFGKAVDIKKIICDDPDEYEYLVEDIARLENQELHPEEVFSRRNIFAWYRKLDNEKNKVFLLYVDDQLEGFISFKEHKKMSPEDFTLALKKDYRSTKYRDLLLDTMSVYVKNKGQGKRTFMAVRQDKNSKQIRSLETYLLSRGLRPELKISKKRNSTYRKFVRLNVIANEYKLPEGLSVTEHDPGEGPWLNVKTKNVGIFETEELISSGQFTVAEIAGALSTIHRERFHPELSGQFWDLKEIPKWKAYLTGAGGTVLVAVKNGGIVGFIKVRDIKGKEPYCSILAVKGSEEKKGIGKLLIDSLFTYLRKQQKTVMRFECPDNRVPFYVEYFKSRKTTAKHYSVSGGEEFVVNVAGVTIPADVMNGLRINWISRTGIKLALRKLYFKSRDKIVSVQNNIRGIKRFKMSQMNIYGNNPVTKELWDIQERLNRGSFFRIFKKISWWRVPLRMKRSFEFLGQYEYTKGAFPLKFILKRPQDATVAFVVSGFYETHKKNIISMINDGIVPFYLQETRLTRGNLFELDLSPFGYQTLYDYLDKNNGNVKDDFRERIRNICKRYFRNGGTEDWICHYHLHLKNILVKPDGEGGFEDIRLIDWTMLHKQVRASDMEALIRGQVDLDEEMVGKSVGERLSIEGIDLSGRDLTAGNLAYTYIPWSDLSGAILTDSDLTYSQMMGVEFYKADLRGSNLTRADLTASDLTEADLRGADLADAVFTFADLTGADLRGCKGITQIKGKGAILNKTKFDLSLEEYFSLARVVVEIKEDHLLVTNKSLIDKKRDSGSVENKNTGDTAAEYKTSENIKFFQALIKKDIVDDEGRSYYSPDFLYDGKTYDKNRNEQNLNTLIVRSPGVRAEEDKDRVKYYVLKDIPVFGGKPVFIQQEFYEKMKMLFGWSRPEEFKVFLFRCMKTRYGKEVNKEISRIKESLAQGFIFMLYDSSPSLFGNHSDDGIIGVNRLVFEEIKNKNAIKTLIGIGLTHEIAHECGENDEELISLKDAVFADKFARVNNFDLEGLVDALFMNVQEGSLFLEKAIEEYLRMSEARRTYSFEIQDLLKTLKLDEDSPYFVLAEYMLVKISVKSENTAYSVFNMIKAIAAVDDMDPAGIINLLLSVEKAVNKTVRVTKETQRVRAMDVWTRIFEKPYVRRKYVKETLSLLSGLAPVLKNKYRYELDDMEKILDGTKINEDNYPRILKNFFKIAKNSEEDPGHLFEGLGRMIDNCVITTDNVADVVAVIEKISSKSRTNTTMIIRIINSYLGNLRVRSDNVLALMNKIEEVLEKVFDTYGETAGYMLYNIQHIAGQSELDPENIKKVLEDIGLIPGEAITSGTALLLNVLMGNRNVFPPEYNLKQSKFMLERISHPAKEGYKKVLAEVPGLRRIELTNGGFSMNDASMAAKTMLLFLKDLNFSVTETDPYENKNEVFEKYGVNEIALEAGLSGETTFIKALGRTLIFADKNGDLLCLKIKKKNESVEDLSQEPKVIEFLNKIGAFGENNNISPVPVKVKGNSLVRINIRSFEMKERLRIKKTLAGQKDKTGADFTLKDGDIVFAYKLKRDSEYNRYLQENTNEKAFIEAILKSAGQLGALAKDGLVHTSLIDIFHNLKGDESGRRYIWSAEMDFTLGRQGAGRLTAWQEACKWPNISKIGELRDLAEVRGIDEVANDPQKYFGKEGGFFNDGKNVPVRNGLILQFMGEYALALSLLYGDWMVQTGELPSVKDEKKIADIARNMREIYLTIAQSFLGEQNDKFCNEMDLIVNWERLAKQMVFFMGDEYIKYVDPERRENYSKDIWEQIYGETLRVSFGKIRENTFDPEKGFIGDESEIHFASTAKALGPVGGALPLQEIITANYYVFTTAIAQKKFEQQRQIEQSSEKYPEFFEALEKVPGLEKGTKTYNDMVFLWEDVFFGVDRGKRETLIYAVEDLLDGVEPGRINKDNILYISRLFKEASAKLGDNAILYAADIFLLCLEKQEKDLSFLRKVVLTMTAISEVADPEDGKAIRALYNVIEDDRFTSGNADIILGLLVEISQDMGANFGTFINVSMSVIEEMPIPYEEAVSMIQKIGAASGAHKAIRSLNALRDILCSEPLSRQDLECLLKISENSLSNTADAYRRLYPILQLGKEAKKDISEMLIYLSEISVYSGTATEYVYLEIDNIIDMDTITQKHVRGVLQACLTIVRCSEGNCVKALRRTGGILECRFISEDNMGEILEHLERIAKDTGKSSPEVYLLVQDLLFCADVGESNCAEVIRLSQSVMKRIVDTTGEYSRYVLLMLHKMLSFRDVLSEDKYGYIEALIIIEKIEKKLEGLFSAILDPIEGLSFSEKRMAQNVLLKKMYLESDNETEMEQFIDNFRAQIKQEGVDSIFRQAPGTGSVGIKDGGLAPNLAADIAVQMLKNNPEEEKVPVSLNIDNVDIHPDELDAREYSVKEIKEMANAEIKGDLVFVKAMGRTIVFKDEAGNRINIKIRKKGENLHDFYSEPVLMEWAIENKYQTDKNCPIPLKINGKYFFTLDMEGVIEDYGNEVEDALDSSINEARKKNQSFAVSGGYEAFAYRVNKESGYDSYLQENNNIEDVKRALISAAEDLGHLAAGGLVHTSLIEIFHNTGNGGRRYMWTQQLNGLSAGRLASWKTSCLWPNIGKKGEIRDWADVKTIKEIREDPIRYLGEDGEFISKYFGKKSDQFMMMHFLGEYALSLILLYGDWLTENKQMPEIQDTAGINDLGNFVRDLYLSIVASYADIEDVEGMERIKERYAAMVDWEIFAMQMSLFMTAEHAVKISETFNDEKRMKGFWKKIFGENADVIFGELRKDTFDNKIGFKGDGVEGQLADTEPALGPVNGAFVITELIKANYYLCSAAVCERAEVLNVTENKTSNKNRLVEIDQQTDKAKRVIADRRTGTADIILMPCSSIFKGQQFAVGKDLAEEQFSNYIKLFYYSYDSDRRGSLTKEIEKGVRELMSCMDKGDHSARQLIYLDQKDAAFAKDVIIAFHKQMEDISGITVEELMGRITIVPISNLSGSGILDDMNFIVAATGLLNAKRFEAGDYPGEVLPEGSKQLLVDHLDTIFEDLDDLGDSPSEIIKKILVSAIVKIKRKDFSDIQAYKSRQREFLKSL